MSDGAVLVADDFASARTKRPRWRWRSQTAARLDALVELLRRRDLTDEQLTWLRVRWRSAIWNALNSAMPEGLWTRVIQFGVVFGSLTVPILASFNAAYSSPNNAVRFLVLGVSVVVALGTAVQEAFRFRANFALNWATAGALEAEAWAYLHGVNKPYDGLDPTDQWKEFVRRVEGMLVAWNTQSLAIALQPTDTQDEGEKPVGT